MAIYNFGVGTLVGVRTGVDASGAAIVNPTPARFGALQDVQVDFDRTLKELIGQYQFPLDIAAGQFKISGKAKTGVVQGNLYNSMFFGQTLTSAVGAQDAVDEPHTVATTVTIAPPASGVFVADLGVFYKTTGVQFVRVASAPAVGQYSVVPATGVYTFNATDVGVIALITYNYSVTTATVSQITLTNQLMGISPSFALHLQLFYPNNSGIVNSMEITFNACKSSKFSMPFKNQDFTIVDFDFMPFADASNTVGTITFTQ